MFALSRLFNKVERTGPVDGIYRLVVVTELKFLILRDIHLGQSLLTLLTAIFWEKTRVMTTWVVNRVHAGGYVERRLALIFGQVLPLIVEQSLQVFVLEFFFVRSLTKSRMGHFRASLNAWDVSSEAIETLLIKETLREHISWTLTTPIMLELFCVQIWGIIVLNHTTNRATTACEISPDRARVILHWVRLSRLFDFNEFFYDLAAFDALYVLLREFILFETLCDPRASWRPIIVTFKVANVFVSWFPVNLILGVAHRVLEVEVARSSSWSTLEGGIAAWERLRGHDEVRLAKNFWILWLKRTPYLVSFLFIKLKL